MLYCTELALKAYFKRPACNGKPGEAWAHWCHGDKLFVHRATALAQGCWAVRSRGRRSCCGGRTAFSKRRPLINRSLMGKQFNSWRKTADWAGIFSWRGFCLGGGKSSVWHCRGHRNCFFRRSFYHISFPKTQRLVFRQVVFCWMALLTSVELPAGVGRGEGDVGSTAKLLQRWVWLQEGARLA